MKDHKIANIVNIITGIARIHGQEDSIRNRISEQITPILKELRMTNEELLENIRKIVREELYRDTILVDPPNPYGTTGTPYTPNTEQVCLHDGLPKDSIHMISCPCPKCSPRC